MKKQFFRVKQLADQTFLRAEKSDVLNHKELEDADRKVEYLRAALAAISKRMKKYNEHQLGQVLQEQSQRTRDSNEDECKLLQFVIRECSHVELELAKEQSDHELKVDNLVTGPIQTVVDNDLPNISRHKRNLNKYILDKDSASNRYHAASKNGNQKEALKDDMEEADIKVEQHRDAFAAEMFSLLRKESELSQCMLQLLKLQRAYHESALKMLERVIPEIEQKIGDSPVKTVFGLELEEHLRVTKRRIAFPLELCICVLQELGLYEEGLFRVAGGASRVKRLKLAMDSGCFSLPLLPEYQDVHVVASTLKSYLRDLPEPLLTYSLYDEWMNAMRFPEEQRVRVLEEILKKLPKANKDNLACLVQFLSKLSKNPENKMTASNIAIVMAPNLLWSYNRELDMHMNNCTMLNMIVELFINKVDVFFPDDMSSHLTYKRAMLLSDDSEMDRPNLTNVKLINYDNTDCSINYGSAESMPIENASPKPQMRMRKTKLAPNPPGATNRNETEFQTEPVSVAPSYPSGSTTLNRSHKTKTITSDAVSNKPKIISSEDNHAQNTLRRQSLVLDAETARLVSVFENNSTHNRINDIPKAVDLVNLDDTKTAAEVTYVSQPVATVQVSKAKPIAQISAQTMNIDKITITSNHIVQKPSMNMHIIECKAKPVAAPRVSIANCEMQRSCAEVKVTANPPESLMSKSLNSMDIDGEQVQIRRTSREDGIDRSSKPVVPVRPPSLKAVPRSAGAEDPTLHRTQCSVYSVANKQQPSFVNIHNRNLGGDKHQPGHDTQMAEKERFLLNQSNCDKTPPRLSCADVNSNYPESVRTRTASVGNITKPDLPSKLNIMKSNEKISTDLGEKLNGNAKPSHMRTQSDGNIVESGNIVSLLQTPPSPRSVMKPLLPPPPPPVNRARTDADSTDL